MVQGTAQKYPPRRRAPGKTKGTGFSGLQRGVRGAHKRGLFRRGAGRAAKPAARLPPQTGKTQKNRAALPPGFNAVVCSTSRKTRLFYFRGTVPRPPKAAKASAQGNTTPFEPQGRPPCPHKAPSALFSKQRRRCGQLCGYGQQAGRTGGGCRDHVAVFKKGHRRAVKPANAAPGLLHQQYPRGKIPRL